MNAKQFCRIFMNSPRGCVTKKTKTKKKQSIFSLSREKHNAKSELISYNNYNLLGLFEYNNTSKAINILTS